MLRSVISCLVAFSFIGVGATKIPPTPTPVADIVKARQICDSLPLMPVEGIWLFPDDNVSVLLCREDNRQAYLPVFNLIVVDSEDVSMMPGDTIGSLSATPKADTFALKLFTARKKNILGRPFECEVRFDSRQHVMLIPERKKPLRFRFNINPNSLLPGFLKLVRMSVSNNGSEDKKTHGMVRIYPSYDGNGSLRTQPRYL